MVVSNYHILGEMIQFDYIIFVEMGWVQPPTRDCCSVIVVSIYLLYTQHVLLSHTHTDVSLS